MSRTALGSRGLAGIAMMAGLLQPAGALAANAAPVASNLVLTNVSGTAQSFMVSATDDTVAYYNMLFSVVRPPSNGTVTATYPTYYPMYTCYLTYTATNGFTGQDSFTFKANDGTNDSNVATVTIRVNPNLPPVAAAYVVTGVVGSAISLTLPVTDDAVPTYQLVCSVVQPPSNGTLGLTYSNNLPNYTYYMTYRGTNAATGQDSFTFKANDGVQDSNLATCTVRTIANSVPVAQNQWVTNTPGISRQAFSLSYTHANLDSGQTMTWIMTGAPAHGTLEYYPSGGYQAVPVGTPVNNNYWYFTPTPGYAGPDSITWKVSDGVSTSAAATVSIFIKTNNPPVARDVTRSMLANTTNNLIVLPFTHADSGQPMSYGLVSAPSHGTLVSATNSASWRYTPAAGYSGPDPFTWRVSDSLSASTGTVSIKVITLSAPSTPPAFRAGVPLMDGTNALRVWKRAVGARYEYADTGAPATGAMAAPELVDWNDDGLMDLLVGQADGKIALFINQGTRGHPVFKGYTYLKYQNGSYIQVKHGCVCLGGGPPCGSPRVADWNHDGKKDLIVGEWGSVGQWTQVFGLNVYLNAGTDGAPVFTNRVTCDLRSIVFQSGIGDGGRATSMPFVTDMNGDGISDVISGENNIWFSASGQYGSIGAPSGLVNIFLGTKSDHSPSPGSVATDGSYNPSDSFDSATAGYTYPTLTVTGACPVASRKSVVAVDWTGSGKKDLVTGMQDGTVWFSPNVGTPELPVFTNCYRLQAGGVPIVVGDPAKVGQDPGYRNAPSDYHGSSTLNAGNEARISVGDLDGDGLEDLVVGDVNGYVTFYQQVNPRPVAIDQQVDVTQGAPKGVTLAARVDTGHAVTFAVLTAPAHGTLSGSAPALVYTPDAGYRGEDSFTFQAADGPLASQPGAIRITVKNHPPVALAQDAAIATMNRARTITLQAQDAGDEPLAYSVVTPPAHGTYTLASNVVTYVSSATYAGPDSFSWKANDGHMDSNVQTVSLDVTVLAVNFQPTNAPVPPGYVMDSGALFDAGRGYGWDIVDVKNQWGVHYGPYPVLFDQNTDPRMDTCVFAQTNPVWTCSLPNGNYYVTLAYGNYSQDGLQSKFQDRIAVQGVQVVDNPEDIWGGPKFAVAGSVPASVTDGLLRVTIGGVSNTSPTRLDYLEIRQAAQPSGWATFVREDAGTQGAWQGAYGADGYWFGNSAMSLPTYATILGPTEYIYSDLQRTTWSDPTTQARALQHPWGADRVLSGWYAIHGFEYDLNLNDGAAHRLALYATDMGGTRNAWTQRIDILDAGDGTLLDSRTMTSFTDGKYQVWDLKGHVKVKVMPVKGNAIVNALFFGSGASLDSNEDGLPDWWQIRYFGSVTSASAAPWVDSDGDGFSNWQEYLAGTNPNDAASHLKLSSVSGDAGGTGLAFETSPGVLYDVYWKSNLVSSTHWQLYTSVVGSGGPAHVTFTNQVPQGFFQIQVAP